MARNLNNYKITCPKCKGNGYLDKDIFKDCPQCNRAGCIFKPKDAEISIIDIKHFETVYNGTRN